VTRSPDIELHRASSFKRLVVQDNELSAWRFVRDVNFSDTILDVDRNRRTAGEGTVNDGREREMGRSS
jgi:hypothetical protein